MGNNLEQPQIRNNKVPMVDLEMDSWMIKGSGDVYGGGGSCGDKNVAELKTLKD